MFIIVNRKDKELLKNDFFLCTGITLIMLVFFCTFL